MDSVKEEPDSQTKTHPGYSPDEEKADVKREHLAEPFSFVEVKQELEDSWDDSEVQEKLSKEETRGEHVVHDG